MWQDLTLHALGWGPVLSLAWLTTPPSSDPQAHEALSRWTAGQLARRGQALFLSSGTTGYNTVPSVQSHTESKPRPELGLR